MTSEEFALLTKINSFSSTPPVDNSTLRMLKRYLEIRADYAYTIEHSESEEELVESLMVKGLKTQEKRQAVHDFLTGIFNHTLINRFQALEILDKFEYALTRAKSLKKAAQINKWLLCMNSYYVNLTKEHYLGYKELNSLYSELSQKWDLPNSEEFMASFPYSEYHYEDNPWYYVDVFSESNLPDSQDFAFKHYDLFGPGYLKKAHFGWGDYVSEEVRDWVLHEHFAHVLFDLHFWVVEDDNTETYLSTIKWFSTAPKREHLKNICGEENYRTLRDKIIDYCEGDDFSYTSEPSEFIRILTEMKEEAN
jgi:hypothetical protein